MFIHINICNSKTGTPVSQYCLVTVNYMWRPHMDWRGLNIRNASVKYVTYNMLISIIIIIPSNSKVKAKSNKKMQNRVETFSAVHLKEYTMKKM
jgi:hypothetical protein